MMLSSEFCVSQFSMEFSEFPDDSFERVMSGGASVFKIFTKLRLNCFIFAQSRESGFIDFRSTRNRNFV